MTARLFRRSPLRGYRLPARRAPWRPLHSQVARMPVAGVGVDPMIRAFDFFDRVFEEGRYRPPGREEDEWRNADPGWVDDPDIPF